MTDDIVKETLQNKYHHPMKVLIVKGRHSAHEHPVDYGDSDSETYTEGNEDDQYTLPGGSTNNASNTNIMEKQYEYICITCNRSLKCKKPKMPAQACVNGLILSKIPPELENLSDLERQIIALRIPFMVIFCLVRYGSQYKICGGCTNVPAPLDQVVDMLPRMSNEVQFHPMRLKKRMNYKSSYMYNYICRDVIIAAIKWLKVNNKLYHGIELNDSWAEDWLNSEF